MKNNNSNLTVNIPINFPNIDLLVQGTNINPDKLRVLLHQMYFVRLNQIGISNNNNFLSWVTDEGFVPLHSIILKSILTSNYKKYISFLLEKKLLTVRESPSSKAAYSPGFASKHYKLNTELFQMQDNPNCFRKEVITDKCTIKAVLKTLDQYKKKSTDSLVGLSVLNNSLYKMEKLIKFNTAAAENWVVEYVNFITTNDIRTVKPIHKIKFDLSNQLELIRSINEGEFSLTIDKFGERLHTPLKRVSRQLRPFLCLDGHESSELLCLDIANSQLYFLSLLMNANIVKKFLPEFYNITAFLPDQNKKDIDAFNFNVTNGSIYDDWRIIRNLENREAAKGELIQLLFDRRRARKPGGNEFKKVYPSVWLFLDKIKSLKENILPFMKEVYLDKNGLFETKVYHKNVSCAAQRLESRVFIKIICNSILTEGLTPFITIHDSIYFPKHYHNKICEVIKSEFDQLGIPMPKLKLSKIEPELNKK